VYLSRDDKARQAISLYKAIHLDVWWTFADDEGVEIPPSRTLPREPDFAEIARLEATLRDHELCWTRFFEQGGIDPIRVRYTDIATAYEGTVTAVCDALDRPRQGRPIVRPRLRRQADAVTDDWERRYRDSGVARCGTA
jgi:LPS sulfotransferase NodH